MAKKKEAEWKEYDVIYSKVYHEDRFTEFAIITTLVVYITTFILTNVVWLFGLRGLYDDLYTPLLVLFGFFVGLGVLVLFFGLFSSKKKRVVELKERDSDDI